MTAQTFEQVDPETLEEMLGDENPLCPLNQFIGNKDSISRLKRLAYQALQDKYHRCNVPLAFLGPSSVGKTTLAKLFGKTLGLPFIEIHPKSCKDASALFKKINSELMLQGITIQKGVGGFSLPPMIIFIDEAHGLSKKLEQSLLKGVEGVLEADFTVCCKNVCWIIATTDRGMLFDAFDTRFMKIGLSPYSVSELRAIVFMEYPDIGAVDLVVSYGGRIPRELKAFAAEVIAEHKFSKNSWEECVATVGIQCDRDISGLTGKQRLVLKLLVGGAMAKKRLASAISVKEEELEKFILPALLCSFSDSEALVGVSSKGYILTSTGMRMV